MIDVSKYQPEGARTALGGAVTVVTKFCLPPAAMGALVASTSILWFIEYVCVVKGGAYKWKTTPLGAPGIASVTLKST